VTIGGTSKLRKLDLVNTSGGLRLTVTPAASIIGVSARTLQYHLSSGLLSHASVTFGQPGEGERSPWRWLTLEQALAYRAYLGGPDKVWVLAGDVIAEDLGGGRPWGVKRDKSRTPGAFSDWYAEKVAQGWGFLQGAGYVGFGPGDSQGADGCTVYEITYPERKPPLLSSRTDTSGRTVELSTTPPPEEGVVYENLGY